MRRRSLVVLALWTAVAGKNILTTQRHRQEALSGLAGKTLRVAYTNPENPLIWQERGEWTGVLPDFFKKLVQETGFLPNFTTVSQDSIDAVGTNLNSACPRDIYFGRVDMCIGNPWVTTQRLGYAKVMPTFWLERINLVVRKTEGGFVSRVLRAFMPFDTWLWICIALVIICYGIAAWAAERHANNRDFPDKSLCVSTATSLYHGFYGFAWSEPANKPITAEGRTLALGFGLFIAMILASYTATLTSVLLQDNTRPEFLNLENALTSNSKVCIRTSMLSAAVVVYPALGNLYVAIDSWIDGYNRLDRGECGSLLLDPAHHASQQQSYPRDCDKQLVGEPIFGIPCAWFVAERYASSLSFFISELMDKGVLDELRRTYTPRITCDYSVEATTLEWGHVSGVIFITGAFAIVALVVHIVIHSRKSGALTRLSTSIRKRATMARSKPLHSTAGPDVIPAQVVGHQSPGGDGAEQGRTSGTPSRRPRISGLAEDPSMNLVQAFHREARLTELPFEKTLLIIGEARSEANMELLEALSRMRDARASRASKTTLATVSEQVA